MHRNSGYLKLLMFMSIMAMASSALFAEELVLETFIKRSQSEFKDLRLKQASVHLEGNEPASFGFYRYTVISD